MPVTSGSVPHLRSASVAEQKKTPEPTAEPKLAAKPKLGRAAESGDPAVQWLLAEQASHGSVGNQDKVAEMERRLNELGYTAL